MNKPTQAIVNDLDQLTQDTHLLIAATADTASEHIGEARKRLTCMMERGKELYGDIWDKGTEGSRAADVIIRENLYRTLAVGVGAGVIIGFLIANRCVCKRE